jgi:hypothetical protein
VRRPIHPLAWANREAWPATRWHYTNDPFENRKREKGFEAHSFEKGREVFAGTGLQEDILYLSFAFTNILALFCQILS